MREFRSSYNRVIYLTCFSLILIASAIEGGQYIRERDNQIRSLEEHISEYASNINVRARAAQGYVEGIRGTAEEYINYVKNHGMKSPLWPYLKQNPENGMFTFNVGELNKKGLGNLSGLGILDQMSRETLDELQMALLLNPGFRVALRNTPGAVWIYYTSVKQFQNRYPWLPPNDPIYYQQMSRTQRLHAAGPEANPHRQNFWTSPYDDGNVKGSRYRRGYVVSNISPVYDKDIYLGAVSMDISLHEFELVISKFLIPTGALILFNETGEVLGYHSDQKDESIEHILSTPIGQRVIELLKKHPQETVEEGEYLICLRKLPATPWVLVFVGKPSLMFEKNLIHGLEDIMILALSLIFVVGIGYFVVTRDFISPAQKLLDHIKKENQGEATPPTGLPARWGEWFKIVSTIFAENRSLLKDLESRVKLRTQQLQKKNRKLEKTLNDLKKAQDQIILQEKLASLGALTAGIAHEIKNPLHFIINFTDVSIESLDDLMKGLPPEKEEEIKEVADNMARVLDHAKRADSIVKGMLAHARGSEGKFEMTDLNRLISDAVDLAYVGFCGKEQTFPLEIEKNLDSNLPSIKVSSQDLSRVFLNIANNACYAMYDKFAKGKKGYDPTLKIRTSKDKNNILVTIEDNGMGMSKSVMKKIFHPFFTTKDSGKGTGLGLSLSYEILTQQHQGKVWIESKVNKYSRFHIKLPC